MEQIQAVQAGVRRRAPGPSAALVSVRQSVRRSYPVNVRHGERLACALAGGLALAWGASRRSPSAVAAALVGAGLVVRGVSGHCPAYGALGVNTNARAIAVRKREIERTYDIARSITIQAAPEVIFRALSDSGTFATVLGELATVSVGEDGRSRWQAPGPLGRVLSWETEVVESRSPELLRWSTVQGSPLRAGGGVHIRPAPGDRGTEVRLQLRFEPPFGALGSALTKLLGPAPALVAERALRNLRSLLEAGELPSLHHNPAARASAQT